MISIQYYGGKKDEGYGGNAERKLGKLCGGMGGYERLRVADRVPTL